MRAGDAGAATGHEVLTMVDGIRSARLDERLPSMLREARQFGSAAPVRIFLD